MPTVIVGGGISGIAAATEIDRAGHPVVVLDRGRRIGGRLAVRTLRDTGTQWDGRPVDIGASYFTARHPDFVALAGDWERRGLARPWTDTLQVADADGLTGESRGTLRWAAPGGLRSLVEDSASRLGRADLRHPHEVAAVDLVDGVAHVDGERADAVLICAPDPQAARLLAPTPALDPLRQVLSGVVWEPVLALTAVYDRRCWPEITGVFVNGSEVLSFIADDGSRRGDGAAVLVAHAAPGFAAGYLDEPAAAGPAMVAALVRVLGIAVEPSHAHVHRWSLARPTSAREEPHHWDGALGVAGDSWHGGPRVEAAWLSGRSLGRVVAEVGRA